MLFLVFVCTCPAVEHLVHVAVVPGQRGHHPAYDLLRVLCRWVALDMSLCPLCMWLTCANITPSGTCHTLASVDAAMLVSSAPFFAPLFHGHGRMLRVSVFGDCDCSGHELVRIGEVWAVPEQGRQLLHLLPQHADALQVPPTLHRMAVMGDAFPDSWTITRIASSGSTCRNPHSTTTACCWRSLCVRDLVVDSCTAVGLTCFGPFGFVTLLTGRCSTGENFNGIMNDLSVQEPFCDPVYEGNCGYAQGCCRDPYCRLCTTHPRMCGYARWGPSARKEGGVYDAREYHSVPCCRWC